MLTIKRVPTFVSMNQDGATCGRDCLGTCCIPGATFPLYSFARRYSLKPQRVRSFGDLHTVPGADAECGSNGSENFNDSGEPDRSFLDTLLIAQWEDRMERGLFRYDVTACETKVLAGNYGFIAQLNEGRHLKKRPTEFRVDTVLQDFDPKKFNFTKVGQEEVLFRFEESTDGQSSFNEAAPVLDSPNVVVINVSPIEYGHVLLVPRVLDCLNQRICADTLLLALHMAVEADNPYLRIGYNSLGAFATINHLHFQAYYLSAPFPIERAPTVRVSQRRKRKRAAKILELTQYPVRALVYEVGSSLEELALMVASACERLQEANTPFNVLIADRGARVFLIPQCFAERQARGEVPQELLDTQVNPAVWEISGHIVLKRREDYERATQASAWDLLSQVSLSEEVFQGVKQMCLEEAEKAALQPLPATVELPSPLFRAASRDEPVVLPLEDDDDGELAVVPSVGSDNAVCAAPLGGAESAGGQIKGEVAVKQDATVAGGELFDGAEQVVPGSG